jgi:nucleoside phosphorylase
MSNQDRPEWLHYKSRYGINEILFNYNDEDRAQDFLFTGLHYGCHPNQAKTYHPNIMILDTFLSDGSDRALFQKIRNHTDEFPIIHILMANPYGYFANQRHEKIGSNTHNSPISKTITGLENILQALRVKNIRNIRSRIARNEENSPDQVCRTLIQEIQQKGGERLKLKFYDEYPTSPMYFFNDILMLGRFGAARNCMEMAWYMFVDEQSCDDDLFDENRKEFIHIWEEAQDEPTYPDKVLVNGSYISHKNQKIDVAIICTLKIEIDAVLDMGLLTSKKTWDWEEIRFPDDNNLYNKTVITTSSNKTISVVAATSNHMGSVASSCLTTTMLRNFQPNAIILVGIAAGTSSSAIRDRDVGDILIADQIVDHSSGKILLDNGIEKFLPDYHPIPIHEKLLSNLNALSKQRQPLDLICSSWKHSKPNTSLKAHVGTIGTGNQVVANPQVIDNIKEHWRKLIGIEMEAYGVYFAASKTVYKAPYFCCFKSISDFADSNKTDDFQAYAAYTAAEYCNYFLVHNYDSLFS